MDRQPLTPMQQWARKRALQAAIALLIVGLLVFKFVLMTPTPGTILMAATTGKLGSVAAAVEAHPALVHEHNAKGETPLHLAAGNGHRDVVLYLLNHGADVNARDRTGATPLHAARMNDETEVATILRQDGGQE